MNRMKKPFIHGYYIKKDELRLPIEKYEEAGYDVVEDGDYWIIGAINEYDLCKTNDYMDKICPWQYFTSFKFKKLGDSDDDLR